MNLRRKWLPILIGGGVLYSFIIAYWMFGSNVTPLQNPYPLLIQEGATQEEVMSVLRQEKVLIRPYSMQFLLLFLPSKKFITREGRYLIHSGMSNWEIFKKIKSGQQDPVRVVIQQVRDLNQLASKLDMELQLDSLEFLRTILDPIFLDSLSLQKENILSMILPNTYDFYWTVKPRVLIRKLMQFHNQFWSSNARLDSIQSRNLDQKSAYILASIVEKESQFEPERPLIAGVYLNRIKIGMKLQADPTAVFATGRTDVFRVNHDIIQFNSPYNTYVVEGLPPGPICMPSLNSLESVINSARHSFLFFCALPGYEGKHAFAQSAHDHFNNARVYRNWLNSENIH